VWCGVVRQKNDSDGDADDRWPMTDLLNRWYGTLYVCYAD